MRSLRKATAAAAIAGSIGLVSPAFATTIDIVATADGQAFLLNGNPLSTATTGIINTSQNVVPGQELRSVYEFDLSSLTESIVSVTFLASVVQNSSAPGELSFFGFAGNGTIEGTDTTQTSNLLGSTTISTQPPTGSFVPISVALSPGFIAALGSGFLGLTTTAGSLDTISIASLENTNASFMRPTLRVETQEAVAVPEPGSILCLASGLAALAARRRTMLRR
jgi:hypothetical protein